MKHSAVALASAASLATSFADGKLYIGAIGDRATAGVEGTELVIRVPVAPAAVTHAILRFDTEDRSIVWLELHMQRLLDPGDHYTHFDHAEEGREQFYVRASEIHDRGCKWALRFHSIDNARSALSELAKAYALSGGNAEDKTKGKQKHSN